MFVLDRKIDKSSSASLSGCTLTRYTTMTVIVIINNSRIRYARLACKRRLTVVGILLIQLPGKQSCGNYKLIIHLLPKLHVYVSRGLEFITFFHPHIQLQYNQLSQSTCIT